jgi:N6-L-threonylcarbamoyladenine synthase
MILALETSCDETCAAVVDPDGTLVSSVIASQAADHVAFGGVVPEIASRRHLELVEATVEAALAEAGCDLRDVTAVAVTVGPGLIGALLVGLGFAKGLAVALDVPLLPVDHLAGHVASLALAEDPPRGSHLVLLASGGHTLLLDVDEDGGITTIARSLDDAAGEAFDKGARLLGLPYPGGPFLSRLAEEGDPGRFPFAVPLAGRDDLAFSFSGLKTALRLAVERGDASRADLAAAYEEAIVAHLLERAALGLAATGRSQLGLVGGVAANRRLRAGLAAMPCRTVAAPPAWCGDNAAMIGLAALRVAPLRDGALRAADARARSQLG